MILEPATSKAKNVTRFEQLLDSIRRLSIKVTGNELNFSFTIVFRNVTENLRMKKVCDKFVCKVLSDDQKTLRAEIWSELL